MIHTVRLNSYPSSYKLILFNYLKDIKFIRIQTRIQYRQNEQFIVIQQFNCVWLTIIIFVNKLIKFIYFEKLI
jgi:hypothetical protein